MIFIGSASGKKGRLVLYYQFQMRTDFGWSPETLIQLLVLYFNIANFCCYVYSHDTYYYFLKKDSAQCT
jgi:hypothetical protein